MSKVETENKVENVVFVSNTSSTEDNPKFLREIEIGNEKAVVIAIFEKYFIALAYNDSKK